MRHRYAPRDAGQPTAQAAAARVGRRSRRDVSGYAAAAWLGRRPRRDESGIISFTVSVFPCGSIVWDVDFPRAARFGAVVLGLIVDL